MKKNKPHIRKLIAKIQAIADNPELEFRYQCSGTVMYGENVWEWAYCDVCENPVQITANVAYHDDHEKCVTFCTNCYEIMGCLKTTKEL